MWFSSSFDEVDVGMGQFKALDLGLRISDLVSPPAFLCLHRQGQFSNTVPAGSPNATDSKGQGSALLMSLAGSPMPLPPGLPLPCPTPQVRL